MGWKVENINPTPHQECGYVGRLVPTREGVYGSIYVQTWLYGCAQNGLFGFNQLSGATAEDFETLKKFLSTLRTTLKDTNHGWVNKRFIFILTSNQLGYSDFIEALVKDSKLMDSYPNLAHGGLTQYIYRLDV